MSTTRTSSGSLWRECAIVAVVFALCLLGGAFQADDTLRPPPAAAFALGAVSSAIVLARRRSPVGALVAASLCGMLAPPIGLLTTPLIVAPAIVCAYSLASRLERRTALTVLIPSSVLLIVCAPAFETGSSLSWEDVSRLATVVAAPLLAGLLGRAAQQQRRYVGVIEERARRAEDDREAQAHRKVAEERLHIARELHDLVAHQIALANAQAAVAERLFDSRPDQSRKSVGDAVTTTRRALDELRAAVGFLRQPGDRTDPAAPAPGLLQLPALIESFGLAGLQVMLRHGGTPVDLSPAMDLTVYRVVQESLTNVTAHSTAGDAQVVVSWTPEQLTVTISNEGRAIATDADRRPGFGILGMRERVSAFAGELTAGRGSGGGFVVTAALPLGDGPLAADQAEAVPR